jgi:hypothetical protein
MRELSDGDRTGAINFEVLEYMGTQENSREEGVNQQTSSFKKQTRKEETGGEIPSSGQNQSTRTKSPKESRREAHNSISLPAMTESRGTCDSGRGREKGLKTRERQSSNI